MKKIVNNLTKLVYLILCFIAMGFGVWLTKEANIGLAPWNSLNDALSKLTPFTFGQISQLLGVIIILFAAILGVYPGIGTFLNIYFIGAAIDVFDFNFNIELNNIILNIILLIIGCFFISFAFIQYIKAGLGQGPRDSFTHAVYAKFNFLYGYVRFTIEAIVLIIAISLGGSFGIGTFIALFSTSFFTQKIITYTNFNPKSVNHQYIHKLFVK